MILNIFKKQKQYIKEFDTKKLTVVECKECIKKTYSDVKKYVEKKYGDSHVIAGEEQLNYLLSHQNEIPECMNLDNDYFFFGTISPKYGSLFSFSKVLEAYWYRGKLTSRFSDNLGSLSIWQDNHLVVLIEK